MLDLEEDWSPPEKEPYEDKVCLFVSSFHCTFPSPIGIQVYKTGFLYKKTQYLNVPFVLLQKNGFNQQYCSTRQE